MRDLPHRKETLNALRRLGHLQAFTAKQVIFARGDLGKSLAVIESGVARVSLVSPDGRELVFQLMAAGDIVGEIAAIDGRSRTADVVAVGKVTARIIPAEEFRGILYSDKHVASYFFALICDRLRSANNYAESHALNSLAGRLSIWFVNNGDEHEDGSLHLINPPSQTELARLVGGARESVNRQFRAWRDEGLLITDGRNHIIPDPVRLQEQAMAE